MPVGGGGRSGMGMAPGGSGQGGKEVAQMPITNGGLGNLDIGWLNSRRDTIGRQKEGELWKEARRMLEDMAGHEGHKDARLSLNGNGQHSKEDDPAEDDMDVDV